jgi:hypothetical protein
MDQPAIALVMARANPRIDEDLKLSATGQEGAKICHIHGPVSAGTVRGHKAKNLDERTSLILDVQGSFPVPPVTIVLGAGEG